MLRMEMDPVVHLRYVSWATRLILDAAKALSAEEFERDRGSSHGGIKATMVHIFQAEWLWFTRVSGEPAVRKEDVPAPSTLDELDREWMNVLERWQKWVAQLTPKQVGTQIRYKTMAGQDFSTPIWQIILHLVNHDTLHRGQVMAMMRQAGVKPPATDLIFFYREMEAQAAKSGSPGD